MMHCNETPPTLGVKGKPPKGFAQAKEVLKKLLAKDPAQRFPNAAALSEALHGVETGGGPEKLFAFGRAQAGDKKFKSEMLKIAILLVSLTFVYFFLASKTNNPLNIDRKERLNELFRLGSSDTFPTGSVASIDEEKYLLKAIKFAESSFGENSLEAAEAYSRMGRHIVTNISSGQESTKSAYENYNHALQIIEYLDAHQPSLRLTQDFKSLKRRSLLDLATVSLNPSQEKELVDKALELGPLEKGSIYWNYCQAILLKQQRYFDAAIALIQMQTGKELHLTKAELEELKTQNIDAITGKYKHLSDVQSYIIEGTMLISPNGNDAECEFKGIGGYQTMNRSNRYLSESSLTMTGSINGGVLKATTSKSGIAFPFLALRVGKYLAVMDTGGTRMDSHHKYIPSPLMDSVFTVE